MSHKRKACLEENARNKTENGGRLDRLKRGRNHARCLKLQDAPDLDHVRNPHFFYVPRHTTGVMRVSFDILIQDNCVWFMGWRDNSQPYRVGLRRDY